MQQAKMKRCKPTYLLYKLKQQQDALIRKLVEKRNETDTLISSTQGNSCHKKKDSNNIQIKQTRNKQKTIVKNLRGCSLNFVTSKKRKSNVNSSLSNKYKKRTRNKIAKT